MRIDCCHCGPRGHEEFVYLGDASHRHAAIAASGSSDADLNVWGEAVHLRDNPAGPIRELWQHVGGCRAWLVVTRDTRTHEMLSVEPARSVALAGAAPVPDGANLTHATPTPANLAQGEA